MYRDSTEDLKNNISKESDDIAEYINALYQKEMEKLEAINMERLRSYK